MVPDGGLDVGDGTGVGVDVGAGVEVGVGVAAVPGSCAPTDSQPEPIHLYQLLSNPST